MHPRSRDRLLVTLLAGLAFLPYLNRPDIVTSHEARLIQVSRAMAESGWPWNAKPTTTPDVQLVRDDHNVLDLRPKPNAPPLQLNPWLVPILNGQVRLQKPPLPYWATATLYRIAGGHNELTSRLIPALLGFASTFLIAALARRLIGRRASTPAALLWASSYFIPDEYRKAMADPYLAFFTLVAIWAWVRASHFKSQVTNFKWLVLAYVAIGLGLLSKGHPLLPHLVIPIALYHVLYRRRIPGRWWLHLLGLAIVAAITLPWALYILKYVPSAPEFWRYESTGRLSDNVEQYRPWHFYLPLLLQISLPWTALWLMSLGLPRRRGDRRPLFPLLWFTLIVLFFSIFKHKKLAYLLPALPAMILMITQALLAVLGQFRRGGRKSVARMILLAHAMVIAAFSAVLIVMMEWEAVLPLCVAVASLIEIRHRRGRRAFIVMASAAVLALGLFFMQARPKVENRRSPRHAAREFLQILNSDPQGATLPAELPPEATAYLPLDLPQNPAARTIYLLIDDKRDKIQPTLDYAARKLPGMKFTSVTQVPLPNQPAPRWKLFAFHK